VQFGIQDDAWLEFGPGSLQQRVARLDRIGFDVVRVTLHWQRMEPRRGRFDWRRSDRLLRALDARGLRPVVTLWGTPPWANNGNPPNVAPLDGLDFRRFVERTARRYPFVDRWVMWNEPNKRSWLNPPSPENYVTQILNPGYAGVKAVLRSAKVAGGVTAPRGGAGGLTPVDFISGMRGMRARLDAYAHHPYPTSPGDTPYVGGCGRCKLLTMARVERLLRIVGTAFPRARVWFTEYGYQTNPPDRFGVSPNLQARYIGQAARRVYRAPKVDLLIHYIYRDEPDLARWQSGLETVRGRAKPALSASMVPFMQVSRRGLRTTVWGQVRPGDGPQRYVLQQRRGGAWANVGRARLTNAGGYLVRSLTTRRGAQLRVWCPARKVASITLIVR
jgi:hypothetical protein